ncbi:MAG: DUF1579 domain-containing protein [Planctomycetota bacterium]|nr:DUF1579 domain-containing protein [Planctomycetota bacterium]
MRASFVLALSLALALGGRTLAEDAAPGMDEAGMKLWQEKTTPGPEHEALMKLAGEYEVASKMFMAPEQPPQEGKGAATFTPVLGGRFLKQEYKGEMMGQPFDGLGFDGYDKIKKEYVTVWFDSMGTWPTLFRGKVQEEGKSFEFHATCPCPITNEEIKFRAVHATVSADSFIFTMYETRGGKENKMMELTYTRKK